MRRLLATCLTCLTLFAPPAQAYTLDQAMAEIDALFQRGANPDEMALGIAGILRSVKASGVIDPDLAILYAMLADHLRLEARNPAYALQVAEDGLALIAGDAGQSDFQAALMASRAYALADLGRFAEAHAALTLALPTLARTFGAKDIADYKKHAAEWAEGQLGDFNTSALDIARDTLETAYDAQSSGSYGRVLVLAGSALLPMDTSFAEADLRAVNTEAEKLTAEALFSLGRHREAANAYMRALGYMTTTPWQLSGHPDWWGHVNTEAADIAFSTLNGLAAAATEINRPDVERAALAAAMDVVSSPRQRYTLLQRQARILAADGQIDAALDLLMQSRAIAEGAGLDVDALVAEFYVEMMRIYGQLVAQEPIATAAFIAVTDRVLAAHETHQMPNRDFFLYSAANVLRHGDVPDKTLEYARKALRWRQADLARKTDTGFGATQARRASRDTLEFFLHAAHTAASASDLPGQRVESCPSDDAYTSCLIVMPSD
ncbi:hypothetical protein [Shimia aestuarii]|uniref:Tetratricopeptide repeat-containing protein n=1 Tax=Shimia aestuarii TaxID=254406 RepID=A0A1I4K2A4_9RHOB|nr:hypothetical protein [Shimia aestuarii]SFL72868.1 hypothetical protein SAMN04488042_1011282 [Shimia aestuarii]